MVDMAALAGAAGALKTAYDLSKTALSAHDASIMRAKVTEMQAEISAALASAIAAQQDQMALLQSITALEKEIADLKDWERQRKRYELKRFEPGVFAQSLKPEEAAGEDPHLCCAKCFEERKRMVLQAQPELRMRRRVHLCPECRNEYVFGAVAPEPLLPRTTADYDPLENFRRS